MYELGQYPVDLEFGDQGGLPQEVQEHLTSGANLYPGTKCLTCPQMADGDRINQLRMLLGWVQCGDSNAYYPPGTARFVRAFQALQPDIEVTLYTGEPSKDNRIPYSPHGKILEAHSYPSQPTAADTWAHDSGVDHGAAVAIVGPDVFDLVRPQVRSNRSPWLVSEAFDVITGIDIYLAIEGALASADGRPGGGINMPSLEETYRNYRYFEHLPRREASIRAKHLGRCITSGLKRLDLI